MVGLLFKGWFAVGLALMATIGVPEWLAFSNGLFLVFFALYALDMDRRHRGEPVRTAMLALGVGIVTFAVEWIGVATGFPFGAYEYTPILGVAVAGVPLAIACAWMGVVFNAVLLSEGGSRWGRAVRVGLWTVLLDLVLDPVADARGFWIWDSADGGYYGVPAVNFASWFAISAALSLLFPVREPATALRREAGRLMQLMLFMFGVLALKDQLWLPAGIAVVGILLTEGAIRHYTRRTGQAVQQGIQNL